MQTVTYVPFEILGLKNSYGNFFPNHLRHLECKDAEEGTRGTATNNSNI